MRILPEALLQNARKSQLQLGQALVEFALLIPLILFMIMVVTEIQFLFSAKHTMQIKTDVLAQVLAERVAISSEDWDALVFSENSGTRCATTPDVKTEFPDTSKEAGDRVKVTWSCPYAPMIEGIWPGLTIAVESEAVINSSEIEVELLPSPEPSAS
jgi:hypothetical protein